LSLKNILQNDLKEAMKAKNIFLRDTLRNGIMSPIKQIEVDERRELSDADILKIIQKGIKQREDSIEQYRAGNREDLIEKEQNEIDILLNYLPKQLSDEELESKIKEIVESLNAQSMKDMGKVMGVATKSLSGSADGKRISAMVKSLLS